MRRHLTQFGDSLTGRFDDNVRWPDFIDQKCQLAAGYPLKSSERIFSALDIPATKNGFLLCRYSFAQFEKEKKCSLAPLSTAWTLPGYITLPHMDNLSTAIYTIHWNGSKLWLLWPAMQENMKKMEDIRLDMPNIEAALSLVDTLDGLEVMYLTQQDYFEFSFYILPNTIHCCLSFTESCHSGACFLPPTLVSEVQCIVDWE